MEVSENHPESEVGTRACPDWSHFNHVARERRDTGRAGQSPRLNTDDLWEHADFLESQPAAVLPPKCFANGIPGG